jgi:hypothetical protein
MTKGYLAVLSHQRGSVFDDGTRDGEKMLRNIHMGQDDAEMFSQQTG